MKETSNKPDKKNDLTEIRNNVTKIKQFCDEEGLSFKKPLLVLGTFERVGSNWLLDTLNQHVHTHNEPFKQQLGEESGYSTMSPQIEYAENPSPTRRDPFSLYWLETFVNTKYGTTDHAIKETNLFFALQNFLKFFPDSPILILKREPLGIFSSFISQDLFNQWHYGERYEQLKQVSFSENWESFRFIFNITNEQNTSPIIILTRLLFLNTLLLAYFLNDRPYEELSYEASIKDCSEVLRFLSTQIFPEKDFFDTQNSEFGKLKASYGIFNTRHTKNILEAFLDTNDEQDIFFELNRLVVLANTKFAPIVVERTKKFLNYDKKQYSLVGRKHIDISSDSLKNNTSPAPIEFILDKNQSLEWRNVLVTNEEYCLFLNELRSNGINNVLDGGQIFFNENMIHERGGRIHFNKKTQKYEVSVGYKNSPVYWITWIGASVFALYKGLRLPKRAEINSLVQNAQISLNTINAGYKSDDVQSINAENYIQGEVNDIVGNLAVWCSDGQEQLPNDPQSITRYIYGTAWNKPATLKEITKDHFRPLVGNSRAVGVRLVKDLSVQKIPPTELIKQIKRIPIILREKKDLSLHDRDRAIISLFNL